MSQSFSWHKKSTHCDFCLKGSHGSIPYAQCVSCPPGRHSVYAGASQCRNCTTGMYNEVRGQFKCQSCESGKYSMKISASKNPCMQCPNGGNCMGKSNLNALILVSNQGEGDNTFTHSSYWRDPAFSNMTGTPSTCFYKCIEPRACLGTNP